MTHPEARDPAALARSIFTDFDTAHPEFQHLVVRGLIEVQGVPVDVEWLRQHYRSKDTVLVRIPSSWVETWGENVHLPVPFDVCTVEQLTTAVRAFFKEPDALCACPACGTMTWNRKHYPSQYRDERCSPCWFAESRKRLAALQAEENRKLADYDAKQKADGMTHKVTAVIHPKRGGDDHIIDIYYSAEPTEADVEKYLKRRSSVIDYKITAL